ncbi:n-6 DNA Methylase [Clostridium sp. CAG:470]|nr:n-6 DNA Methylase [Clostridium sp. CAG:470]
MDGNAHENRVYKKEVNIFTDEQIQELNKTVRERIEKKDFSKVVTIEDIKNNDYSLFPSKYFEIEFDDLYGVTRNYDDILNDLNRIIKQKNCLKLTINESIAKSIGIYDVAMQMKDSQQINTEMNKTLKSIKLEIEKENYITLSKNKNEIRFENNSKEQVSEILMLIMNNWKMMMYHLNNEENRYLVELRDKLLPDLMSGKINLDGGE